MAPRASNQMHLLNEVSNQQTGKIISSQYIYLDILWNHFKNLVEPLNQLISIIS